MIDSINIKGARQHNLKNISLLLPKEKLIVFTGVSGSGKSSLAFDTIYAEGQRRYVESLSSYARQFLGIMDKPDVDMITGLSPSISIDQKSTSHNPRSTVGTVTEIYDYLRLLYARIGHPHCPNCGLEIQRQTIDQIVIRILELAKKEFLLSKQKFVRIMILSPVIRDRKGEFGTLFSNIRSKGYKNIRVDGIFYSLDEDIVLIKTNKHSIDVAIDKLTFDKKSLDFIFNNLKNELSSNATIKRLTDAVEQALLLSQGVVIASNIEDSSFEYPDKPQKFRDNTFSEKFSCPVCNINLADIEPRNFSFNSPHGACPKCSGIGTILSVDPNLIIAPEISISEGGIIPFAKMFINDTWFSRTIMTVCAENNIDTKIPIKRLNPSQLDVIINGTGDRIYQIAGKNRFGDITHISEPFNGITFELKKRLQETQSEYVRSEIEKYMRDEVCDDCKGKRLKNESLTITINKKSIADITSYNIINALKWISSMENKQLTEFSIQEKIISTPIFKEIKSRLGFLENVGLDYLTLDRSAASLSGGEAQRIRLASQIGSGLSGVLYVLDEPSIGLHPKDNSKLIKTLKNLRDMGNTMIVVEHDRETMEDSDLIVDFGPGAGSEGGQIIAVGTPQEIINNPNSITGSYLSGKKIIKRKKLFAVNNNKFVTIKGVTHNNLKNIDVSFPIGNFICITGVSGSGKSSLIVDTLYQAIFKNIHPYSRNKIGQYKSIEGLENIDKVILIDQSPIGRTPRSNPATYTGIFTYIRDLYSQLPESKMRGFKPGRFSFNIKGGRCEACEGEGMRKIEMQFLSDVYVTCEVCGGKRYNNDTLDILYHGKNISEVLDMTFSEGLIFFRNLPLILEKIKTIVDVGLGYMKIGQSATTLSGGEAQRVKLATELMKRQTGKTMYILDEPTTGLHFADLVNLLEVLHKLSEIGNTVIVIEHNMEIIKNSDYIIDLGPDGGDNGGQVVATGTLQQIINIQNSYTGQFLKKIIK